uniref:von Willebrand factor type A domain protein n=1 Tax=uncultured bacterium 259 TaxID=698386 RepID=E3T6R2_9BACT|nr:von Willebrand factor type A domain protein [uncultured bacterium 259]
MIRPIVLAAIAAVALQGTQDQRPTFRSRTDLITVDVAVTSHGSPVSGLTLADFELADNGVRQTIEMVDAETLPIDLTVVVDTSGSMRRSVDDLKADAQAIAAMLRPNDRIRLLTFAGQIRETYALQAPSADLALDRLAATGSTSLFDAVAVALAGVTGTDRRHLVVVLTDGQDTSSVVGRGPLADLSAAANGVLYAAVSRPGVLLPPPGVRPPASAEPLNWRHRWMPLAAPPADESPLKDAVENTGGVWDSVGSIARAPAGVKRALEWFRTAYVLRYRATGVAAAGWHELHVKVGRAGEYDVRARKGYVGQ